MNYELLVCGLRGHALAGVDAERLREEDSAFAREMANGRWHRCLRCDGWFPVAVSASFAREYPPPRKEIALPLRGRALRSRIILRLIALDRGLHTLILAGIAAALLAIAADQREIEEELLRLLSDFHGGAAAPLVGGEGGLVGEFEKLVAKPPATLRLFALGAAVLAATEAVEAVGLWMERRWAEYLTLLVTVAFVPLEIYELIHRTTPLKIFALVVNVAIVIYLLLAKRLFGLRGGGAAVEAERLRDSGWAHLEATAPAADRAPRW